MVKVRLVMVIIILLMFSACGNRGSDIELSRDSGDYNVVRVIENGNEHLIVTNQSELSSDLRYYINGKFVSNIDKKYTHRGSLLLDLDCYSIHLLKD